MPILVAIFLLNVFIFLWISDFKDALTALATVFKNNLGETGSLFHTRQDSKGLLNTQADSSNSYLPEKENLSFRNYEGKEL